MRWIGLLLLVSGCTQGPAIAPDRIVSNNPCIDSILADIAEPSTIGAISLYSQNVDGGSAPIAWAERFPAIGVSAEEVIAARPRLVLTGNYASTGTNAALKKAGIRVEAFGVPATLAENRAQVLAIAHSVDRTAEGADLAKRMDEATKASPGTETAIIWQTGGFVAGRGTIQDEMLTRAGFRNASSLYGLKQWDVLPIETLLRNPPDIIFTPVSARGDEARGLTLHKKVLRHLNGRTRLIPFPEKLLFCGGPTVIAAMQIMRKARASH